MTDKATSRRDLAIDAVRGVCVMTMVASHLAPRTGLDRLVHPVDLVDGAAGFVLLSGLLTGMVQRSATSRGGARAGIAKLLRRTRLVYGSHLVIACAALAVAAIIGGGGLTRVADPADRPWWETALAALTLQVNPEWASVLSIYVVAMIAAIPLVAALTRGWWRTAAAGVGTVYLTGMAWTTWSTFPVDPDRAGTWSYAAWAGLFGMGLLLGWRWREDRVQSFATGRSALVIAAAALSSLSALGAFLPAGATEDLVFGKAALRPGAVVLAVAFYFLLWRGARMVAASGASRLLTPWTLVGSRSLDAWVALSLVVVAWPVLTRAARTSSDGMAAALLLLLVLVCWSWLRARYAWIGLPVRRGQPAAN